MRPKQQGVTSESTGPVPHTSDIGLLRLMTCGSVDDGKSTLIGRLLVDAQMAYQDHIQAQRKSSGEIDYAGLLDGLLAEREQGITIDVAYRYFASDKRKFIVADTPGHEQYTRNMATAASVSDLAVILIDAEAGLKPQTRRHAVIAHLFGIRHVVAAVNKMDKVGYDETAFRKIEAAFTSFARQCGLTSAVCLPVSALKGDNICEPSDKMTWYTGPTLLSYLENVKPQAMASANVLRFPVQWACRPDASFRGYAGTVESGDVRLGQNVVVLPSNMPAKISDIVTMDGSQDRAETGEAIMLTLDRDIDVSRGNMIVGENQLPDISDQIIVNMVWMEEEAARVGACYTFCCGPQKTIATITAIQHKVDVETLIEQPVQSLSLNDVGQGALGLATSLVIEPFAKNRMMGSFILCDKVTHRTVAAGTIRSALSRGANLHWQNMAVDAAARAQMKGQRPFCLWFTGLSGAGKSTIADLLEKKFFNMGLHTYTLDGDNVRHGLNRDLGFSDTDRMENIRRVAEVARLMVDAGLIVIVSFISPFRAERAMARDLFPPGSFYEIFVDAPFSVCEERDPKGLYKKAREGLIPNFTGLSSPYETPENPDLCLDTSVLGPLELAEQVVDKVCGDWLLNMKKDE
ncbi:MAG: adenylyl-sulfate kinase [Alphaproteobacteria bacterium]|jgi:bifunctional enzyme CysN/CysC|nr:adenylyl-sulfate kinase [Alphaproteobacteria bacterium]